MNSNNQNGDEKKDSNIFKFDDQSDDQFTNVQLPLYILKEDNEKFKKNKLSISSKNDSEKTGFAKPSQMKIQNPFSFVG